MWVHFIIAKYYNDSCADGGKDISWPLDGNLSQLYADNTFIVARQHSFEGV